MQKLLVPLFFILSFTSSYALNAPILKATPSVVEKNQTTSLSWSAVGFTTCTPSWSKNKTVPNGTITSPSLAESTSFFIACKDKDGHVATSSKVVVTVHTFMNIKLSALTYDVPEGATTTLSWQSTDAQYCSTSWGTASRGPVIGKESSPAIFKDTQFSLSCTNVNGVSETNTISVKRAPLALSFSVGTSSVTRGGTTTISYKATGAESCTTSWNKALKVTTLTTASSPVIDKDLKLTVLCKSPLGKTVTKSITIKAIKVSSVPAKDSHTAGVALGVGTATIPFSLSFTTPSHVVKKGASLVLNWKSDGLKSCGASFTQGAIATSGVFTIKKMSRSTTPTINCTTTSGLPISRNLQIEVQ